MNKNWKIQSQTVPQTTQELLELILSNRDIKDVESFLHPKSPLELTLEEVGIKNSEVKKALKRLEVAKEKQEKIIIFGDYDCDGVCATAVLWETMHLLGFAVFPFIPDRQKHGYGLSAKAIDEILAEGKPGIVISVDNGIVAHAQWQRLIDEGIFTILTDHHDPDGKKSPADVLVHTTALCGTTVAWMLAREIENHFGATTEHSASLLDLCAIATIADQVPLFAANRSFTKYGLEQLNHTNRLGLRLLMEVAGLNDGEITTQSVNYGIAPRINAMGRLGHALDALRALCTKNETRARELIGKLHETNVERQDLTKECIDLALSKASQWKDEHIIVIADASFHEGIIGLIASKLTEEFHKPSIVISIGELTSKGSCRSIKGVHITNLVREMKDDVMEIGGHPMAAGLRLVTENIENFSDRIRAHARQAISAELFTPTLEIDCVLPDDLADLASAVALQTLAPFGAANREPLFLFAQMAIGNSRRIGREGKHIKMILSSQSETNRSIDAIGFGMGSRELPIESVINCVGNLSINVWKGNSTPQILLKDYDLFLSNLPA